MVGALAWERPFLLVKALIASVAVTVAVSVAVAMVADCSQLSSMLGAEQEQEFLKGRERLK